MTSVRVDAVGDYEGPRFAALHIIVEAVGPRPDELADILQAAQRVCYVTNTLRAGVIVNVVSR